MTERTPPYSPEVRTCAVWMVLEHQGERGPQWAAIRSIAAKIGCSGETLRGWVRQGEREDGPRAGPTSEERERIKSLDRGVRELRRANEILRKAGAYCPGGARPPGQTMRAFIGEDREAYGVGPICRVLPAKSQSDLRGIAPSTHHEHAARRADPSRRVSRSARAEFVLDALEQALQPRQPFAGGELVHPSDRGCQYVSIRCTKRLAEAGIEPSVGSVGASCDTALAETVIGLFKTEVTHRRGPWRSFEAVAFATLEEVDWLNNRLEPIGNIPPAEAEDACCTPLEVTPSAA